MFWPNVLDYGFHTVSFSGSKVSLSAPASSSSPCVAAVKYAKDSKNTDKPCNVLCAHDNYYERDNVLTLSTVLQDADPLTDISQIKCCLVLATHVLPDLSYNFKIALILLHRHIANQISSSSLLTNLHHLAQLCQISSNEIKECKFVKVLRPLIAHFHNLVVALQQCSFTKAFPAAAIIQSLCSFQSYLHVHRQDVPHFCSGKYTKKWSKFKSLNRFSIIIVHERIASPQCFHIPGLG